MYKYIIYHSDIAVIKLAIVNGGPTLCRYTVGPHMGGFSDLLSRNVHFGGVSFSRLFQATNPATKGCSLRLLRR